MFDSAEGYWSIGPIVGMFQPENFTETQSVDYAEPKTFGTVPPLIFKKWTPREVELSFVVNSMCFPAAEEARNPQMLNAVRQSDPEIVWATIMSLMRKISDRSGALTAGGEAGRPGGLPSVIGDGDNAAIQVTIPGWGLGNGPTRAVLTNATFKRTHISGNPPRCVRGVITVTLKELRLGVKQRGFSRQQAGIGLKEGQTGGLGIEGLGSSFDAFVGG
jgi:hypothetical protein